MSNQHVPVKLRTNIRKLDTDRLTENEVLRYQSTITSDPQVIGQKKPTLTAKEKGVVHQALLHKSVNEDDKELSVRLNKSDVLAKIDNNDALTDALAEGSVRNEKPVTTQFLAILTVYDSHESPPAQLEDLDYNTAFPPSGTEDESAALIPNWTEQASFKRFSISAEHSAPSRRWLRVHLTECDVRKVEHDSANPVFSLEGVRFYLVSLALTRSTLSVRDALKLSCPASEPGNVQSAALSKFEDLAGVVCDDAGEPYRALEQRPKVQPFPGTFAVTKPTFHVHPGPNEDLLLSANTRTTVQIDSNFTSLADFVTEHYRSFLGCLQSPDGVAMLQAKLKGVHIRFSRVRGSTVDMITSIEIGTASLVPAIHRHYAWPSEGSLPQSPDLPLVNLGTLEKPQYLPMEACQILGNQKLRGPRDVGLSQYVNAMGREQGWQDIPFEGEVVDGKLLFHYVPEQRSEDLKKRLVEICSEKFPDLLFVEAGLKRVQAKKWSDLRNAFVTCVRQSFQACDLQDKLPDPAGSPPLLSLRYESGSDPSLLWSLQLQEFVTKNSTPDRRQIVVVWLDPQSDRNMMYDTIKKVCDVKAGAQTFFVERTSCESRLQPSSADLEIARRTAADIRRRVCLKNPPMLKQISNGGEVKLVIAMHVVKVLSPMQYGRSHARPGRDSERYIVTFVSRDMTRRQQYHTERGIYNKSEMEANAYKPLLQAFFDRLPKQKSRNFVVLRSGHAASGLEHTSPDTCRSESMNSVGPETDNGPPASAKAAAPTQKPSLQSTKFTGEIQAIKDTFKLTSADTFTYVTLTEETVLRTHISELEPAHMSRLNENSRALFCITESPLMNHKERSIHVQQLYPPPCKEDAKANGVHPLVRPGAITATFYRHSHIDDVAMQELKSKKDKTLTLRGSKHKDRPQRKFDESRSHESATPPRPQTSSRNRFPDYSTPPNHSKVSSVGSPMSELAANPADDRSETSPTPSKAPVSALQAIAEFNKGNVMRPEIDLLAAIWKDEYLGFYDTKWPVPTHLARLAAKRAMVHLSVKEWHQLSGDDAAPFVLPEVHQNVRDTLYYL